MKSFVLLVMITLGAIPALSAATDTNAIGPVTFHNVSPEHIAGYLALLARKPIIARNLPGVINFERQGGTREEIFRELKAELETNGCYLIAIEQRYFKLVPVTETNRIADVTHVEVEITPRSIIVEDQVVSFESLTDAVKKRLTPDAEVWIYDLTDMSANSRVNFRIAQNELAKGGVKGDKIFRAFLPP